LEIAQFKVETLENQVKTMVPQLEFKKQHQELLTLAAENRVKQEGIRNLERQLSIEQFAKRIYAAFLLFMVSLIPLLLILRLVA